MALQGPVSAIASTAVYIKWRGARATKAMKRGDMLMLGLLCNKIIKKKIKIVEKKNFIITRFSDRYHVEI